MASARALPSPRPDPVLGEALGDPVLQHAADGAELRADRLRLPHQGVEHDVGLALGVDEIAAGDALRRLELAVDAPVALLQPRWVPGQVEVDEVRAMELEVDPLPCGVGADQDAHGGRVGVGVEGALDGLARVLPRGAGEDEDALFRPVRVADRLPQPAFEIAARVLVFGEHDEATAVPSRAGQHLGPDPAREPLDPRVGPRGGRLSDGQHGVDGGEFRPELVGAGRDGAGPRRRLRSLVVVRLVTLHVPASAAASASSVAV